MWRPLGWTRQRPDTLTTSRCCRTYRSHCTTHRYSELLSQLNSAHLELTWNIPVWSAGGGRRWRTTWPSWASFSSPAWPSWVSTELTSSPPKCPSPVSSSSSGSSLEDFSTLSTKMNVLPTRNVWTTMISVDILLESFEIFDKTNVSVFPKFTPDLFFLYLLPPIILEAAYCLHNEHFFDNIRSILFFAVIGTVINFVLTGGLLIFVKVQDKRLPHLLSRTINFLYFSDHWPSWHRKLVHCWDSCVCQFDQESKNTSRQMQPISDIFNIF